ncbi:cytidylyltransferase family [Fusarium beomiforme]|uniref:Cytidylyltransferase family n=1 Tax=Fusarium beomiforme TaxID=44412 RepID=A0A9P5ATU5_9HYPO|nr:cytidylyltransferase family [Fusarium beomiforme]
MSAKNSTQNKMPLIEARSLVSSFSRALSSFQSSQDSFRILCTLPHTSNVPAQRRPSRPLRNLVILDSSFNPPTLAHASMARSALRLEGEKRLMLLLSVNNADKAPKPASFPIRLSMMEAMGRELLDEGVEIDVAVTTMPFFHDKAKAIADSGFYASEDEHQPTQIFLAGFDTIIRIFNPKYYNDGIQTALGPFFEKCKVRVTTRPDKTWGGVDEQRAWLTKQRVREVGGGESWVERVEMVEGRECDGDVSSSRVREVVKSGEGSLDGLVGDEVRGWIEREALYRDREENL